MNSSDTGVSLPSCRFRNVRYYANNLRYRREDFAVQKGPRYRWTVMDFQALLQRAPTLSNASAETDEMCVVHSFLEKELFISFVHPELFRFLALCASGLEGLG